ncbi:MAG: hypothetical protein JEZ12_25535 [Desulfobacterium sp.]|nr:hypothetical protein [Desulfobacterium sp.]
MQPTIEKEVNTPEWNTLLNQVTDDTTAAIKQLQEVSAWARNIPEPSQVDLFLEELSLINQSIQIITERNKYIIRNFHHANHLCSESKRRSR